MESLFEYDSSDEPSMAESAMISVAAIEVASKAFELDGSSDDIEEGSADPSRCAYD